MIKLKNWKTTSIGFVFAIIFIGYKIYKNDLKEEDFMIAAAISGLGASAKDNNVTGGKIQQ